MILLVPKHREGTRANPFRRLERIVKGFANHRRIQIIGLLERSPEPCVFGISEKPDRDFKTAAEHIRGLTIAG